MPYDFDKLATDLTAAAEHGDRESELLRGVAAQLKDQNISNLDLGELVAHVNDVIQQLIARAQAAEAAGGQNAALQQQLAAAQAQVTQLQADAVDPAALQAADAFLATPAPGAQPVSPPTPGV